MEKKDKDLLLLLTCLFSFCNPVNGDGDDPCMTNSTLDDATRLVTHFLEFGVTQGCDRFDITEGWYRFGGDRNIPVSAPDIGYCGSDAPIWIDGILPKNEGDLRTLTACKVGFFSRCEESWDIDVKNCGLFNVFKLIPVPVCEGRYCLVEAPPRPDETTPNTVSPLNTDEAQSGPDKTTLDTGFPPSTAATQPRHDETTSELDFPLSTVGAQSRPDEMTSDTSFQPSTDEAQPHLDRTTTDTGFPPSTDESKTRPGDTTSDSVFPQSTVDVATMILPGYVYAYPFIPTYNPYSPDRMLMFKCIHGYWSSDTNIDYDSLLYDVRWDIEQEEFVVKSNLNYSQIVTDGILKSSEWKNRQKKIGFTINCAIRARRSENGLPSPYLEGYGYFAGINISPKTLALTSGENAQVWIYPTVPIACIYNSSYACKLRIEMFDFTEQFSPGSQMYCNDSIAEFTKPSLCGLEIDGWQTYYSHPMNITVPANADPNQEYTAVLKLRSSGLSYDKLWDDYHLDPITIAVVNDNLTDNYWYWNYAWCSTGTDPWFWTFDSQGYGFQDEGEFVLFRHKTKPIEVHTIQRKFNTTDSWTENCAVAVRAASDVFIMFGCGRPNKWIIRRLNCKAGADYLKVYHRWDSYEIHLPSGTIVYAWKSLNRRLNINIALSRSDRQDVEGLCGNWNDNYDDDFTSRDGIVLDNSTLFARSWRVPIKESLFVAKRRKEKLNLTYMYCTCLGETRGELSPDVDCSWQENIPVCPPLNWDHEPCQIRSKRSTDDEDDDIIDVSENIVSHKEHPELDNNWKDGWDEVSAKEACLSTFRGSAVYDVCIALESMNVSADLTTCITNIRISGTTEFVQDSLDSFTSQCSLTLRLNTSLHDAVDENGNKIFDKIVNNLCPNDCKYGGVKTGDCVNGFCVCINGYTGDDCRINKASPPVVSGLSEENVCDSSLKGCNAFSIYGDGFYSSDNLRCRLRPGKITDTSIISEGSYTTTTASYKSTGEVKCDIAGTRRRRKRSTDSSSTTHVYLVSVTTNGNDYSDEVPVVIYDSNCLVCTVINSLVLCSTKSDMCIIGDSCHPKISQSCPTDDNMDEDKEWKSKMWILGVVICFLTVIIVFLLVVKWTKHKGRKVIPLRQPPSPSNYEDDVNCVESYNSYFSETTFGSIVSLKNIPPVSTGRILFKDGTLTSKH